MNRFLWNFIGVFITFFILTFELNHSVIPNFHEWINPFFEKLVHATGVNLVGLNADFNPAISSDSVGLYIHVLNLIILSFLIASILNWISVFKQVNLRLYVLNLLTYYISLVLLIYGFDKVFKAQFFLPEPNTLFTPMKDISKDLLYWSTIGVSRSYSMFLGVIEVVTACLLLFRKTRLTGILLATGVMLNVVAVNFSYHISVKVFSLFLLGGCLIILSPYFTFLKGLFLRQNSIQFPPQEKLISSMNLKLKKGLKIAVILLFFTDALLPFFSAQNFNDDSFPRPQFHGAYQIINSDTEIKNMFIHRKGYIIFQNKKDEFQDFHLEVDTTNHQLLLFDYRTKTSQTLTYENDTNLLTNISGRLGNLDLDFELLKYNLEDAPLLKDEFSWTIE